MTSGQVTSYHRTMHHLMGPQEIAHYLGVSRQRVTQLASRPDFPAPTAVLASGKVWRTEDIEEWAKARGRQPKDRK